MLSSLITLSGCASTDAAAPLEMSARQILHPRIDAHLQEMTREEHFSGVALVLRDGSIIHASGYGLSTNDLPNNVDTAFHVASVTKQFTAAAVLQLVESGAVSLHGSINNHLPHAYRSEAWSAVTVHHLLSQSSGIPDYAMSRDYYDVAGGFVSEETLERMIVEAMERDLEFPPGSQYGYSNLGYVLLGEIIEHQSKVSYADYLQKNIFEPMAMDSSRIRPFSHDPAANEAKGFRWSEDRASFVPDIFETLPATPADAGLITTIGDFAKWSQIYLRGHQGILSEESISAMTSQHTHMGRGGSVNGYGYGLGVGDRLIAHSGHVVGFRSQFILDRQSRTVIAVFANNSAVNMERIAFGILTALFSANLPRQDSSTKTARVAE